MKSKSEATKTRVPSRKTAIKPARRTCATPSAETTPQVHCRPAIERIMRIHEVIQRNEFPNARTLARSLEVASRTITRDIDFMRTRLNLPIAFNGKRNGFYYTQPVDQFPSMPVTEAELFSLLVAHKAIAQYHGTPFEAPLHAAFRKLTGQLDQQAPLTLAHLDQMVSFRPFAPDDTDLDTFQTLTRAVQEHRALSFLYRNLAAEKPELREVHPYHLACIENHWYLLAFDVNRAALRTFALTRLREPQIGDEHFTISETFRPAEYLRDSFVAYNGNDDYEVVIHFDSWAADLVRGRRWHTSQEITELGSGQIRLRFRLNSLEEIHRWILSWGTHATVIRPAALVERVRATFADLARRYELPANHPIRTDTDRPVHSAAPELPILMAA